MAYRRRCTNCGKPLDGPKRQCDECAELSLERMAQPTRATRDPSALIRARKCLTFAVRVDDALRGSKIGNALAAVGVVFIFGILARYAPEMSPEQFGWIAFPTLAFFLYIRFPKKRRGNGAPVPPSSADGVGDGEGGGIDVGIDG